MSDTVVPDAPVELPPAAQVLTLSLGVWNTQVVYAVAKLGVCDLLAEGPRTVDDLASSLDAVPSRLARLLRAAAGLGILATTAPGTYALGPLGGCLRTDAPDSVRHFAIMNGEEHYQYWGRLVEAVRSEGTMFSRVFGQEAWPYNASHPEAGETFNRAMGDLARNVHIPAIMQFDFAPHTAVMDIGGGTGTMLSAVLGANPHLRGILFDLKEVLEHAPEVLEAAGLSDRVECVPGDFLESIPAGADVYTVSLIFQDLDDEKALPLLGNVREAMAPGAVFVAVELVVPDDDSFDLAKLNDLNMMLMLDGRIRTADEFSELFAQADLRLREIIPSPGPMKLVIADPV